MASDPRLIEWTGERCVPWAPAVQVIYEHYHRYLWAAPLVASSRVLDLGSGEGFGAGILGENADTVVGIDIDPRSVQHSQAKYSGPNIEFRLGSAAGLQEFPDASFDAVVAFEVIEHIADQKAVISEVSRVLTPAGALIISTPDSHEYNLHGGDPNPFHERELSRVELKELLSVCFGSVAFFGQRAMAGSRISALEPEVGKGDLAFSLQRTDAGWRQAEPTPPVYLLAVATNGSLPEVPRHSTLSDFELSLARDLVADRDAGIEALHQAELRAGAERAELESVIAALTTERDNEIRRAGDLSAELTRVHGSVTWQLFQHARGALYGLIGRESVPGRAVSASLRGLGRLLERRR